MCGLVTGFQTCALPISIRYDITMQQDTSDTSGPTTHFGYKTVAEAEKAGKVADVFHSVAARYDIMNDLMSVGLHRAWKAFTIARANVVAGLKVLDIAGGTGDLAKAFARRAGPDGEVWLTIGRASCRDRVCEYV